jgi:hypothetical protein
MIYQQVSTRQHVAAVMNLENDHGLWLVDWFPMLFDVLTVVLFVAGSLLLWLNLRPSKRDLILTLKETADREGEARHPGEFAAHEPAEVSTEYRPRSVDASRSEEPSGADGAQGPGITVDQNSYAGRVASAMAKLRKPSGGL